MSRYSIEHDALKAKLEAAVDPASWRILEYALSRGLRESDVALWVDESWDDVPFEDLEVSAGAQVGCTVFTEPLVFDGGMDPRDERLLGYFQPRDGMIWVFLGEVSCTAFTTLPDAVCVFAGGLTVESIACFAAPDATTLVAKRLAAEVVLSGMGDGSVLIVPGCALQIGAFHSYLSCAATLDAIVDPDLAERLRDESGWEVVSEMLD